MSEEGGEELFEVLWKRVLEAWDDDKPHAAILEFALRTERLPDLAGRYRALEADAEKSERAKKKLAGIVVAATQMLAAMKTPPRGPAPRGMRMTALIMFLVVVGWLTYYLYLRR
jgi:hypothetical protein